MARMSHLFELRTGYGNRTHIARLRILSTNRYTNPALYVFPALPEMFCGTLLLFGIAKVGIFSFSANFFATFLRYFSIPDDMCYGIH